MLLWDEIHASLVSTSLPPYQVTEEIHSTDNICQ